MFLNFIRDFTRRTHHSYFYQQPFKGNVGCILICTSNFSSLYPLPSSKATFTILGICYSSTPLPDTKICISQGSLGKQNQQEYKIRISTFILDLFLNSVLLIYLFDLQYQTASIFLTPSKYLNYGRIR